MSNPWEDFQEKPESGPWNDFAPSQEETVSSNPVTSLAKGIYKGTVYGVPEQLAKASQFLGVGGTKPEDTAQKISEWGKEGQGNAPESIPEQAGKMIPMSVGIPMGLMGVGKALQFVPHPAAKAVGGLVYGAGKISQYAIPAIFGLSQAQTTRELAQQRGVPEGAAPYLTGLTEFTGEEVANWAAARLFGPLGTIGKSILDKGAKGVLKGGLINYLKELTLRTMPLEISTEMGQNYIEAMIEKRQGIRPEADPWAEAVSAIGPTALMTVLVGGGAQVVNQYVAAKQADILASPIENFNPQDPESLAKQKKRAEIAGGVSDIIATDNPEIKEKWAEYALNKIQNNLPIDVTAPFDSLSMDIDSQMDSLEERKVVDTPIVQPELSRDMAQRFTPKQTEANPNRDDVIIGLKNSLWTNLNKSQVAAAVDFVLEKNPTADAETLLKDANTVLAGKPDEIVKKYAQKEVAGKASEPQIAPKEVLTTEAPLKTEEVKNEAILPPEEAVSEKEEKVEQTGTNIEGVSPNKPIIVQSNLNGSIISLSFDSSGKIPTIEELKEMFPNSEVVKYKPGLVDSVRGTTDFRIDVTDGNVMSSKAAKELYEKNLGMKQSRFNSKSALEREIPLNERYSTVVETVNDRLSEINKETQHKEAAEPDYKKQAKDAGVIFNDMQERVNKPPIPLFTDPKTGTTFSLGKNETLPEALARKRVEFGKKEGKGVTAVREKIKAKKAEPVKEAPKRIRASKSSNPMNPIIQAIRKSGGIGLGNKETKTGLRGITDSNTIKQLTKQYPGLIRGSGNNNIGEIAQEHGFKSDSDLMEALKDPREMGRLQKGGTEGEISEKQVDQIEKESEALLAKHAEEMEEAVNELEKERLTPEVLEANAKEVDSFFDAVGKKQLETPIAGESNKIVDILKYKQEKEFSELQEKVDKATDQSNKEDAESIDTLYEELKTPELEKRRDAKKLLDAEDRYDAEEILTQILERLDNAKNQLEMQGETSPSKDQSPEGKELLKSMWNLQKAEDMSPSKAVELYEKATGQKFAYGWLVPILDKLGVKISFDPSNISHEARQRAVGVYDKDDNRITFNTPYIDQNLSNVSDAYMEAFGHESIHAIIRNFIGKMTSAQAILLNNRLNKLLDSVKNRAEYAPDSVKKIIDIANMTPEELVSYAFTRKGFARWLDSIKTEGEKKESQTVWQKFKNIIVDFIGGNYGMKSKLDELHEIMDSIIPVEEGIAPKTETGIKNKVLMDVLDKYKPAIATRYSSMIESQFKRMVDQFGPTLRGVYNSSSAKFYRETISNVLERQTGTYRMSELPPQKIDAVRLKKAADSYADETISSWKDKIQNKLGELDNGEVKHLDGYRFNITGNRGGKNIRIEQDMIINVSSKGTLFNQFPARIYVDGKFISEAKYKEMISTLPQEIATTPKVKQPWQMTPSEYVGDKTGDEKAIRLSAHPQLVKDALEKGEKVPIEVLEKYKQNVWAQKALSQFKTADLPGLSPEETFEITPKGTAVPFGLKQNKPPPDQGELFIQFDDVVDKFKNFPEIQRVLTDAKTDVKKTVDIYKQKIVPAKQSLKDIIDGNGGSKAIVEKDLMDQLKAINKRLTREQQTAITYYMNAGSEEQLQKWLDMVNLQLPKVSTMYGKTYSGYGKKYIETLTAAKKSYERALKLTPAEKEEAANFRSLWNALFNEAYHLELVDSFVENYVRGSFRKPNIVTNKLLSEVNAGILTTKPREAMQKIFNNYHEAIMSGYQPIDPTIGGQLVEWQRSIKNAIINRETILALRGHVQNDKNPTLVLAGTCKVVEGNGAFDSAYMIKPTAVPDRGNYIQFDHPDFRKYKYLGEDEKGNPIYMEASAWVHKDAYHQMNAWLGSSKLRNWTAPESWPFIGGVQIGKKLLKASSFIKETMVVGSPFHIVHLGLHGMYHAINPFRLPDVDFHSTEKSKITGPDGKLMTIGELRQSLVKHGLITYDHHHAEIISEGLSGIGLFGIIPGKFAKGVGERLSQFNNFMWLSFFPKLKMAMAEKAATRTYFHNLEKIKNGEMTLAQVFEQEARHSNEAFGGKNWKGEAWNPTLIDALQISLFAPDFLLARMSFVASAIAHPLGAGREQATALLRGGIGMFVIAQLANIMFGDDHKMHLDRPFSLIIGKHEYTPRSVMGDLMHLINDPRNFIYNRINPLYGRPIIQLAQGRDRYGRKADAEQVAREIWRSWTPIPLQGFFKTGGQTPLRSIINAMAQSGGISNYPFKTEFEKAVADKFHERIVISAPKVERERMGLVRMYADQVKENRDAHKPVTDIMKNVQDDIKSGSLGREDMKAILERSRTTATQVQMKALSGEDLLEIWDKATEEEKKKYSRIRARKLVNLAQKHPSRYKKLMEKG
jgi:hypothetical protein